MRRKLLKLHPYSSLWNVSGVSYATHGVCPRSFQVSGRSVFDLSIYVIDICELQGTRPDLQPQNILIFCFIWRGPHEGCSILALCEWKMYLPLGTGGLLHCRVQTLAYCSCLIVSVSHSEARGKFLGLANQAGWPLLSVFRLVETWHLFGGSETLKGGVWNSE